MQDRLTKGIYILLILILSLTPALVVLWVPRVYQAAMHEWGQAAAIGVSSFMAALGGAMTIRAGQSIYRLLLALRDRFRARPS